MALLSGARQIHSSALGQVDTVQQHPLNTIAWDEKNNAYIYLQGVGSTIVGSWVTYDEAGVTTLLAANAIGPVAVATAVTDATTEYGWYQVFGAAEADMVANCAADVEIGRETTDGKAGDGFADGDGILGAVSRDATTAAAVATVQLYWPFVNDVAD